jgi:hypothetical protein
MIGRVFGRLTVTRSAGTRLDNRGKPRRWWECECECKGRYKLEFERPAPGVTTQPTERLTSGNTKSCGCLRLESILRVKPWLYRKNPGRKKAS